MPSHRICSHCGTDEEVALHCPCGGAWYCDEECQRRAWETHKELCTVHLSKQVNKQRVSIELMAALYDTTEHYMKSLSIFVGLLLRLADARFDREEYTPAAELFEEVRKWVVFVIEDCVGGTDTDEDNDEAYLAISVYFDARASEGMGNICYKNGEYAMARNHYEAAHGITEVPQYIRKGPSVSNLLRGIGKCLIGEGDAAGAILKLQKAMSTLDDGANRDIFEALVQQSMGVALIKIDCIKGMDMLQTTLKIFRTGRMAYSPHFAQCLEDVAGVHRGLGLLDLALAYLHEALHIYRRIQRKYSPRTTAVLMNVGCIYDEQGNAVEANKFYKKARFYNRRWNALMPPAEWRDLLEWQ
jgi:tetratricopeptide (TPR) repeat protein